MSKENDRIRGIGPEADGIEEYDNPMPDWWIGLFLVTVVWGVYYMVDWHVVSPKSQAALYQEELAEAKRLWPDLERAAVQDASPEAIAEGKEVFATTCGSCHGQELRGGIGPNLVDDVWIHGGAFEQIVATVTNGVAAKGMPAWGPMLGPKKVAAVATFVLSRHEGGTGEAIADAGGGAHKEAGGTASAAAADAPVDGLDVYTKNCVACHGANLEGGVGPNLVDATWIHGGELAQIQTTITNGVPSKGMITWKGVLTDPQIAAVAQFIFDKSHAQ